LIEIGWQGAINKAVPNEPVTWKLGSRPWSIRVIHVGRPTCLCRRREAALGLARGRYELLDLLISQDGGIVRQYECLDECCIAVKIFRVSLKTDSLQARERLAPPGLLRPASGQTYRAPVSAVLCGNRLPRSIGEKGVAQDALSSALRHPLLLCALGVLWWQWLGMRDA